MDVQKQEIGARLKAARLTAHISVEDAAAEAGVQPIAILRWEKGSALPNLVQFRTLLGTYGVMACDVLYADNPWRLGRAEAAELSRAAEGFSPALRARMQLLLAMHSTAIEPVWKHDRAA
jgi:transcriptional regulator with XRE-family HTH domain